MKVELKCDFCGGSYDRSCHVTYQRDTYSLAVGLCKNCEGYERGRAWFKIYGKHGLTHDWWALRMWWFRWFTTVMFVFALTISLYVLYVLANVLFVWLILG